MLVWLCAIAALSVGLAVRWALITPIFANPDENNHYDYVLTIFSAGRMIGPADGPPQSDTHPAVRALSAATNARSVRYDPSARVPPGYGSAPFFDGLNKETAPLVLRGPGATISPAPYISKVYPPGYYAAAAGVLRLADRFGARSPAGRFFAVRFFSIGLLLATLLLTWLLLAELRVAPPIALLITAGTGLLPLTGQVSGSVQPDALSLTLVLACVYVALCLKRKERDFVLYAVEALLLAALIATKAHIFAAVVLAVIGVIASLALARRTRWSSAVIASALILVPALLVYAITSPMLHAPPNGEWLCPPDAGHAVGLNGRPIAGRDPVSLTADVLESWFLGGGSMRTFWIGFGWYGTPITIANETLTAVVFSAIILASLLLLAALSVRIARNLARLARLTKRRSVRGALSIVFGDVVPNTLFVYAGVLFGVHLWAAGSLGLQGRYWFPVLPLLWFVAIVLAPRSLPRPLWRKSSYAVGLSITAVALLIDTFAFASLRQRYYEPAVAATAPRDEIYANFSKRSNEPQADAPATFRNGETVDVSGIAFDRRSAAPAAAVMVGLDDRGPVAASPQARPDFSCQNVDLQLLRSGFHMKYSLAGLQPGAHTFRLFVRTGWSPQPIDTGVTFPFTVAS